MTAPDQPPRNRPRDARLGLQVHGDSRTTDAQAHAAVLVVVGHVNDPAAALELLTMLGLVDDRKRAAP